MTDRVTLRIRQGELCGSIKVTKFGKPVFSFLSIPYARPPINELRFQPPQRPEVWSGTREAIDDAPTCLQDDIFSKSLVGQEDCLYLNVYTPQLPLKSSVKKPVMFWIHGGGFTMGSGNADLYSPDYLMDSDVIVVTINYRVGVLGFLSLDSVAAPGNLGLKDQVAALQWVKENISVFGGDPNNITIFGESAGGASVHYLMLSPLSNGLFHKAIAQSGSALNPWAFSLTNKDRAFKLGEKLGCKTTDSDVLFKFLMRQDAADLVTHSLQLIPLNENMAGLKFPFVPTVEPNIEGAFLSEHPEVAMKQGHFHKVPFITGCTSHEGIICLRGMSEEKFAEFNSRLESNLPEKLFHCSIPLNFITSRIRDLYFRKPLTMENVLQFIDFYSHITFVEGVNTTVKYTAALSNQPVYHYNFQFQGKLGISKHIVNMDVEGTGHADDLGYLFRMTLFDIDVEPDSPEMMTIKRMITLWTNFAKYGNPTPVLDENINAYWKPCTDKEMLTLTIDTNLVLSEMNNSEKLKFWEEVYKSKL